MTKQRANASFAGIALFLIASTLAAQVKEEWVARYDGPSSTGDYVNAIAVDNAGNVYVTGWSQDSTTDIDYATIKYNSLGEEEWVARYNGSGNGVDKATGLAVDAVGNIYVTGFSRDSTNGFDYATVKYNPQGKEEWIARYNGPENDKDVASSLAMDTAGNIYVTGLSCDSGYNYNYATIKYNPQGEERWVARYSGLEQGTDSAIALVVGKSSSVYVTGRSWGADSSYEYATIKYNFLGEEQWVVRYNGPWKGVDEPVAIAVDAAEYVYVTGGSKGPTSDADYLTIKYSQDGEEVWIARNSGGYIARGLAVDAVGNVHVTGSGHGAYETIKYNPQGEEQWVRHYNGPGNSWDEAYALVLDDAGNVYVTGSDVSLITFDDFATVKYNPQGEEEWVARYNGPDTNWDRATALALDDNGNVYVTGWSLSSNVNSNYCTIKYSQETGIAEPSEQISSYHFEVKQLTSASMISYILPTDIRLSLKIYDVTGKLIRTLVTGSQEAGTHTACWDARNDSNQQVSVGLYFIRIATPGFSQTAKVVMLR